MAFIKITPQRGKANSKPRNTAITLGVCKGGPGRASLVFRVPKKIADSLRWKKQDRIGVHFDDENQLKFLLVRTNTEGYCLSPTGRESSASFSISMKLPDALRHQINDRFLCVEMTEIAPGDVQVLFEKL